jgi:hypothetical protein
MIVRSGSGVGPGSVPRTAGSGSRGPKKTSGPESATLILVESLLQTFFSLQTVSQRCAGERAPGQGRQGGEHRVRTSGEKASC